MTVPLGDLEYWEDGAHWALVSLHGLGVITATLETLIEEQRVRFPDPPDHEWYADVYAATQDRARPRITNDDLLQLLTLKQSWYGPHNILSFGAAGIVVRVSDKIERLKNLERLHVDPEEETLRDTLMDLCGYCVLGVMVEHNLMELPLVS